MEIFRISLNSNEFQSFLPTDEKIWRTDTLKMDCKPKRADWNAPELYIHNPKLQQGSFFHLCSGAFVTGASATEEIRDLLEMAGELLPLVHQGFQYFLLNVLECVNCLDDQNTKWATGKTTGAKIRIVEYNFHKKRLSESTLFKIPETAAGEVLCVEGLKDPEDEFKAQVEAKGLRGLIFEKVWSEHG